MYQRISKCIHSPIYFDCGHVPGRPAAEPVPWYVSRGPCFTNNCGSLLSNASSGLHHHYAKKGWQNKQEMTSKCSYSPHRCTCKQQRIRFMANLLYCTATYTYTVYKHRAVLLCRIILYCILVLLFFLNTPYCAAYQVPWTSWAIMSIPGNCQYCHIQWIFCQILVFDLLSSKIFYNKVENFHQHIPSSSDKKCHLLTTKSSENPLSDILARFLIGFQTEEAFFFA